MRISRLLSIAGPSAVLYLLAARASLHVASSQEWAVGFLSILLSLSPVVLILRPPHQAAGRLALLGTSLALAVVSSGMPLPLFAWIHGSMWLLSSLFVLDLALPRALRTSWRLAGLGAAAAIAIVGSALVGPSVAVLAGACVTTVVASGVLHFIRLRRRGYAFEGVLCGLGFLALAIALGATWALPAHQQLGGEFSVATLLWVGNLAWIDPQQRALRRSGVAFVAACLVTFAVGALLSERVADGPWPFGAAAIGMGVLWWVTFVAARSLSRRAAWSTVGTLAERAEAARRGLVGRASLEGIARGVLVPFRSDSENASEVLAIHALQPPVRARLDAGDRANIRTAELPSAYVRAAFDLDSSVLDVVALRTRVVREPRVRELVDTMERSGVGVILRCRYLDQVEALLILPRDSRSEPLSVPEIGALSRLADDLGAALTSSLAQRRAESHIQELSSRRREAEHRISVLEDELALLRGQQDVLGRRLAEDDSLHVAYSPPMRRVQTKAIELASESDPVWIVAPSGASVLPVARFIHDRGPRWSEAFVVGDCGAVRCEEVTGLLFGSPEPVRPGWVHAAAGGTLLLRDLPSLGARALSRLTEWIDAQGSEAPSVRVLATSRLAIRDLRNRDVLPPRLIEQFAGSEVVLPPLRDRGEDLPSLILFAIDRACRVLARPMLGIEHETLALLRTHDWPGDLAELEFVIEFAVSRATGTTIAPSDLPPLAWPGHHEEASLEGTYAEVEKRLLLRALDRARGNKSEAARLLGLKRKTFLDKLGRHQIEQKQVG